jgi:hypothetical protein
VFVLLQMLPTGPLDKQVRLLRNHAHEDIASAGTKVMSAWREAIINKGLKTGKTVVKSGAKVSTLPSKYVVMQDSCAAKQGSGKAGSAWKEEIQNQVPKKRKTVDMAGAKASTPPSETRCNGSKGRRL